MLRVGDDWAGEHFAFDQGRALPHAQSQSSNLSATDESKTFVAVEHGPDGPSATIADAHLLFTAHFARAGNDLVLHGDGHKTFVVQDYYASDERARLLSADGAALSPDVVDALAGPQAPGQYAQAGTQQARVQAVGRVAAVDGDATIVRNGVAITAHVGDAVLKGDVLQTVTGTIGVTFNDGSTLNLTAHSRMVVNEFVYQPNGNANSQLLNLVQGSLTFISGEVAHSGNMKIGTPVATMGIRGTVGGVTTANDGTVHFYVSQSATGAVIIDSSGNVIANVVQDGPMIVVHPVGPLQVLAEEVQKSPQELATELAALQYIINTQAVGQQIIQQFFQNPNNPNPQSTDKVHTQIQVDIHTNPGNDNGNDGNNGNNGGQLPDSGTVTIITPPDPNTPTPPNSPPDSDFPPIVIQFQGNLPPINFGPLQTTVVDEDNTLFFSTANHNAISVFDADTVVLTVTLTATHGALTLGGIAGLTFTSGVGTADTAMTFSGTQTAINAALDGMSFKPDTNYNGPASIKIVSGDANSTTAPETIAITVNPVNDAPVLDFFNLTVAEGGTTVLSTSDFHITDADSSNFFFSFANVTGGQFEVFNGNNWVSAPTGGFTVSDIQHGNVRFVADGGGEKPAFMVWTSDFTDASLAISPTINFTHVNDAPVITLDQGALQTTTGENTSVVFSAGTNNAIQVSDVDTDVLTVTLMAAIGTVSLGALAGLTFTHGDGSHDATMTFSGTQADINAALDGLTYKPTHEFAGETSLTIQVSDGQAAPATDIVNIAVQPEAPTLIVAHNTIVTEPGSPVILGIGVLGNDLDDHLSVKISGLTSGDSLTNLWGEHLTIVDGSITLNPLQLAVLTLHPGSESVDNLTVTAFNTENGLTTATAEQSLAVYVDAAPITHDDNIITNVATGTAFQIPDWVLLQNDTDSDTAHDHLGITDVNFAVSSDASHADGYVAFTERHDGIDVLNNLFGHPSGGSFNYTVSDGRASDAGHVTVSLDTGGNLDGTNNADILVGKAGGSTIKGNGGNDILIGGTGNDTMIGGNGADTFVFAKGGHADTITDFAAAGTGHDVIALDNFAFSTFADLQNAHAITDIGAGDNHTTKIDFGSGDTLTVDHVNPNDLTAADFIFHPPTHIA